MQAVTKLYPNQKNFLNMQSMSPQHSFQQQTPSKMILLWKANQVFINTKENTGQEVKEWGREKDIMDVRQAMFPKVLCRRI